MTMHSQKRTQRSLGLGVVALIAIGLGTTACTSDTADEATASAAHAITDGLSCELPPVSSAPRIACAVASPKGVAFLRPAASTTSSGLPGAAECRRIVARGDDPPPGCEGWRALPCAWELDLVGENDKGESIVPEEISAATPDARKACTRWGKFRTAAKGVMLEGYAFAPYVKCAAVANDAEYEAFIGKIRDSDACKMSSHGNQASALPAFVEECKLGSAWRAVPESKREFSISADGQLPFAGYGVPGAGDYTAIVRSTIGAKSYCFRADVRTLTKASEIYKPELAQSFRILDKGTNAWAYATKASVELFRIP